MAGLLMLCCFTLSRNLALAGMSDEGVHAAESRVLAVSVDGHDRTALLSANVSCVS